MQPTLSTPILSAERGDGQALRGALLGALP